MSHVVCPGLSDRERRGQVVPNDLTGLATVRSRSGQVNSTLTCTNTCPSSSTVSHGQVDRPPDRAVRRYISGQRSVSRSDNPRGMP